MVHWGRKPEVADDRTESAPAGQGVITAKTANLSF